MPKKQLIGVVTSDKMQKSRRVEIARKVKHPKYGKFIRKKTVCHVHDEAEESKLGDTVQVEDQAVGPRASGGQEPAGRHCRNACRRQSGRRRHRSITIALGFAGGLRTQITNSFC